MHNDVWLTYTKYCFQIYLYQFMIVPLNYVRRYTIIQRLTLSTFCHVRQSNEIEKDTKTHISYAAVVLNNIEMF